MKTFLKYTFLAASIAALAQIAHATAVLKISEITGAVVTDKVTITDNGVGDLTPVAGAVTFAGGIDNWIINVDTGYTYPTLGSQADAQMHLSFSAQYAGSGVASSLVIQFSADGFTDVAGNANVAIGGVTPGVLCYSTFSDASDVLFALTNKLTAIGGLVGDPANGGAYASAVMAGTVPIAGQDGSYSLTQKIVIAPVQGVTSGDATLSVPDSGTTLMLLGAGLAGLGLVSRLRRRIR